MPKDYGYWDKVVYAAEEKDYGKASEGVWP
jgi:hypothetical protein